jgi:hypothetical protein
VYQLIIQTPDGAFYVMPPTEEKSELLNAIDALRKAYPEFIFGLAPVVQ